MKFDDITGYFSSLQVYNPCNDIATTAYLPWENTLYTSNETIYSLTLAILMKFNALMLNI